MKNIIKELRKEIKIIQQELADRVEVRRETIVFLEQGKYSPSLELAYRVARVFDKNIEEVFLFDKE